MTVYYLIRHAHADWTLDEIRPLSAEGVRAAKQLAARLSNLPITHIVSSDSLRAQQTVAPLAHRLGLPIILEPDLRERRLIATELSTKSPNSTAEFQDAVRATWQNPRFAHPGGETNAATQARGVGVVQRLKRTYPGGHYILSTHGNLLTLILQRFDPSTGFDFWAALAMPDVVSLAVDDPGHAMIRHLEELNITTNDRRVFRRAPDRSPARAVCGGDAVHRSPFSNLKQGDARPQAGISR